MNDVEIQEALYRDTLQKEKLEAILKISNVLNSTLDLDLLLRRIDQYAVTLTEASAGSILLFDKDREALHFRSSSGEKAAIVRPLPVTDGIAWWVAQHGEVAFVKDAANDSRFTGSIDRISGYATKSILCVPVVFEDEIIGVIEVLNKVDGTVFTNDDRQVLSILANMAAASVRNARLVAAQGNFFTHIIEILIAAIEAVCILPEGHIWREVRLANAIGRKLGMEDQELQDLHYATALRDVCMLTIREGQLGDGDTMRLHTILGADAFRHIGILRNTEPIIRHHHECFDGSGYPDGLEGVQIPLGARIIAVVAAYEQATSEGENQNLAKAKIQKNSGKLFDPAVVNAFLDIEAVDGY